MIQLYSEPSDIEESDSEQTDTEEEVDDEPDAIVAGNWRHLLQQANYIVSVRKQLLSSHRQLLLQHKA